MQVDTSKILFICGGAFAGLDKVIDRRVETGAGIGFVAKVKNPSDRSTEGELLKQVEPEDLIKFGLIPEFIGRLPVVATLSELDEAALLQILQEPKNALTKQYQALFRLESVDLEFREEALRAIAKKPWRAKPALAACGLSLKAHCWIRCTTFPQWKTLRRWSSMHLLSKGSLNRC